MADNLLDKASILLTPTAYNDGEMLSIKPENGDGDFTFSRGSAATRVNAQGLVENVQIISEELVSNGNFSQIGTEEVLNGNFSQESSELITNGSFDTDSDWNLTSGWSISDGELIGNNATSIAYQGISAQPNKSYKVTFTVSSYTSGNVKFQFLGGSNSGELRTSTGTFTEYITLDGSANGNFSFSRTQNFNGSIDNVSVKEVGQNWDLGSGWSIGDGVATHTGAQSLLAQYNAITIGKSYKISFDLTNADNSNYVRLISSQYPNGSDYKTNGTHVVYTSTNIAHFWIYGIEDVTITNISVKEVDPNGYWGFTNAEINNGKVDLSPSANVYTNIGLVEGKKYRITYDILSVNTGSSGITVYAGSTGAGTTRTEIGTYTEDLIVSGANLLYFFTGGGFISGSIDNISVKEVTDDTDIPRINYSGFSYQDSLGSELVTNGDFSVDSNWSRGSNWTISDGKANSDGSSSGQILQSNVFESNKTYQVTFTVTKVSGSGLIARAFYGSYETILSITESGTYTANFTPNASTNGTLYFLSSGLFEGSIDNVSVKEVLGQEVVPDSGCGSWLLEPQSTNLITYSEDFSDSSWAKTQTIIEAANIAMPNGVINGYKLFANTSNVSHWIEVSPFPTATSGQNFTLSLFIKSAGSDFIQVASSTGFNSRYQNFNISTGTKASGDISDSSITDFGNGWYRISVTEITTGTNARYLIAPILSDVGRNPLFAGNANEDGVYIWGAQLENLSYATSYIPTNGAIATRLADVATNSGNSTLINSTEGVLYAEIAALADDSTFRLISISDGTNSNRIYLAFSNNYNKITANITSGGVSQGSIHYTSTNLLLFHKIALKYKLNDFQLWIDGIKVATDTTATMPTGLNRLNFTNGDGVQTFFYGKAKALATFPILTDAELQSLTTQ